MIGKSMARGDDESTPSAGAEAEGRSVGELRRTEEPVIYNHI